MTPSGPWQWVQERVFRLGTTPWLIRRGSSRLGPIPEHQGGFVPGKGGDMARLAGDGVAMVIQGF